MIWLIVGALIYALFIHKGIHGYDHLAAQMSISSQLGLCLITGASVVFFLYCLLHGFHQIGVLPYG